MEWIPYIIVIGQKEVQSAILPVRDRKAGAIRRMKLEELISEIESIIKGKPFKQLPLPIYLSKRPQFYG
jgi:threonyl-tRNA synthetase